MKREDIKLWTVYEDAEHYILFYRGANGTYTRHLDTVGEFHGVLLYPKVNNRTGGWSLLEVLNRDFSQAHVTAVRGYYENIFNKVIPNFAFERLVGWNTVGESNEFVYCCDTIIYFINLKEAGKNVFKTIGKYKIRTR